MQRKTPVARHARPARLWAVLATVLGVLLAAMVLLNADPNFGYLGNALWGSLLVLSVIGPALILLISAARRRSGSDALFAIGLGVAAAVAFIVSMAIQIGNDFRDFG